MYDGEITLARRAAGVLGQALQFDSSEGNVRISLPGETPLPLDEFSMTAWFNFDNSIATGNHGLFGTGAFGLKTIDIEYRDGNLSLAFFSDWPSADTNINIPVSFVPGSWQHLAVTYDANRVSAYLDGELVGSQNITFKLSSFFNVPYIGDDGEGGFIGAIDDFQFFDRALSASEIVAIAEMAQ